MKSILKRNLKIILSVLMMTTLIFSIVGCGYSGKQKAIGTEEEKQIQSNSDTKTLIVYFSWSGNTKKVAGKIKEQTNADIFRILTEEVYPKTYEETLPIAKKERDEKQRPKLSTKIDNINQYDTIFIGYPNWWEDMPMALYTFLDEYDLSGKTIIPFCTNGGSGFSDTINSIKKEEPNANVLDGLAIRDNAIDKSDEDINTWIKGLNLTK